MKEVSHKSLYVYINTCNVLNGLLHMHPIFKEVISETFSVIPIQYCAEIKATHIYHTLGNLSSRNQNPYTCGTRNTVTLKGGEYI